MKFDIAIVGAGPAGCSAAKAAAEKDARVLLIERKDEIGIPCHCAGAVTKRIEKLVTLDHKLIAAKLHGFSWYTPSSEKIVFGSKETLGYILRRELLDKELARLAVKTGVELMTKSEVVGVSNGSVNVKQIGGNVQVKADVIIGADGVGSKVAKFAGVEPPKEIASCIQFLMNNPDFEYLEATEIYWGSKWAPYGYAWIFPRGGGQVLVGLGVRRQAKSAHNYLINFIKNHPIASHKLKEASTVEVRGGLVPLENVKRLAFSNILITGDAAGQVNAVNGAGIEYAIMCGKMAGETAARAVKSEHLKKTLTEYEKTWRKTLGWEFKACLTARRILDRMNDNQLEIFIRSLKNENLYEMMTNFDTKRMFTLAVRKAPALLKLVKFYL